MGKSFHTHKILLQIINIFFYMGRILSPPPPPHTHIKITPIRSIFFLYFCSPNVHFSFFPYISPMYTSWSYSNLWEIPTLHLFLFFFFIFQSHTILIHNFIWSKGFIFLYSFSRILLYPLIFISLFCKPPSSTYKFIYTR